MSEAIASLTEGFTKHKLQTSKQLWLIGKCLAIDLLSFSFSPFCPLSCANLLSLDSYAGFCFVVTCIQFVYCVMVGTFPFNAFLAGIFCSTGSGVLAISLRLQVSRPDANKDRCLMEFLFCNFILILVAFNFAG